MSTAFTTIRTVSAPRHRAAPSTKRAPVPAQQRKERKERHEKQQAEINAAVGEWYSYTLAKASSLGEQFGKKPRYFLDLFFQNGARMVHQRENVNAYNVFKSVKAMELAESA